MDEDLLGFAAYLTEREKLMRDLENGTFSSPAYEHIIEIYEEEIEGDE